MCNRNLLANEKKTLVCYIIKTPQKQFIEILPQLRQLFIGLSKVPAFALSCCRMITQKHQFLLSEVPPRVDAQ